MATKFMNNHINLFLVSLLVFIILIFTGVTVFFQDEMGGLSSSEKEATKNLTSCQERVQDYRDQLSQTMTSLNDTNQDIARYDSLYTKKLAELNSVEGELSDVSDQLDLTKYEKDKFKDLYEKEKLSRQKDAREHQQELSQLQTTISDLRDDIDKLNGALDECQAGG